jgi:hypothetical protein
MKHPVTIKGGGKTNDDDLLDDDDDVKSVSNDYEVLENDTNTKLDDENDGEDGEDGEDEDAENGEICEEDEDEEDEEDEDDNEEDYENEVIKPVSVLKKKDMPSSGKINKRKEICCH